MNSRGMVVGRRLLSSSDEEGPFFAGVDVSGPPWKRQRVRDGPSASTNPMGAGPSVINLDSSPVRDEVAATTIAPVSDAGEAGTSDPGRRPRKEPVDETGGTTTGATTTGDRASTTGAGATIGVPLQGDLLDPQLY